MFDSVCLWHHVADDLQSVLSATARCMFIDVMHFRAVVGGPAMAWPLFLPGKFLKYSLPFKVIAPPYDSISALHGQTTFQKLTTTLYFASVSAYWSLNMRASVLSQLYCHWKADGEYLNTQVAVQEFYRMLKMWAWDSRRSGSHKMVLKIL